MKLVIGVVVLAVVAALVLAVCAVPLALALPAGAVAGLGSGGHTAGGGGLGGSNGVGGPGPSPIGDPTVTAGATIADIPPAMLALYISGAARCPGLPWTVLAAIGKVETDHGRGGEVSPAGAEGPMQFLPATWATYGVDGDGDGVASIWDAADAVPAAADYLCANGGGVPSTLANAIWNYNHSDTYIRLVLAWAATYTAAATG